MKASLFCNFDFSSKNLICKPLCSSLKWIATVGLKWLILENITMQTGKRWLIPLLYLEKNCLQNPFQSCKCFLWSMNQCSFTPMDMKWNATMSRIAIEGRVLIRRYIFQKTFSHDLNPIIPLHLSLAFLNHNDYCEINNERIDIYIFKLVNTFRNVLVKWTFSFIFILNFLIKYIWIIVFSHLQLYSRSSCLHPPNFISFLFPSLKKSKQKAQTKNENKQQQNNPIWQKKNVETK